MQHLGLLHCSMDCKGILFSVSSMHAWIPLVIQISCTDSRGFPWLSTGCVKKRIYMSSLPRKELQTVYYTVTISTMKYNYKVNFPSYPSEGVEADQRKQSQHLHPTFQMHNCNRRDTENIPVLIILGLQNLWKSISSQHQTRSPESISEVICKISGMEIINILILTWEWQWPWPRATHVSSICWNYISSHNNHSSS